MDGIDITLTVSEESLEKILSIVCKYININNISLKHYGHENTYKNGQESVLIESKDKQNVENNDKSIDLNIKENTLVHSTEECSTVHSAENNNIKIINTGELVKPSIEEITKYIRETHSNVNAYKFFKYYEERGWRDGSGEVFNDWKSKVDSWTARERKNYKSVPVKVIPPFIPTEFDDDKN